MSAFYLEHYRKSDPEETEVMLKNLRKEIAARPDMKHRIILRAIKTTKSRKLRKAIQQLGQSEG